MKNFTPATAEAVANARLIESLKEIARMAATRVHSDYANQLLELIEKEAQTAVEKATGQP